MTSKGNHITFARFVLLPVSKEKQKKNVSSIFIFVHCIIKQLLDSVFVISRIFKFQ